MRSIYYILIAVLLKESLNSPIVKVPEHTLIQFSDEFNVTTAAKKDETQKTVNQSISNNEISEIILASLKLYFNSTRENAYSNKVSKTAGLEGLTQTVSNKSFHVHHFLTIQQLNLSSVSNFTLETNHSSNNNTNSSSIIDNSNSIYYIYIFLVLILILIIIALLVIIFCLKCNREIVNSFPKFNKKQTNKKARFNLDDSNNQQDLNIIIPNRNCGSDLNSRENLKRDLKLIKSESFNIKTNLLDKNISNSIISLDDSNIVLKYNLNFNMIKFNVKSKSVYSNVLFFIDLEDAKFPPQTLSCPESFCHFQTISFKSFKIHLIHHLLYMHFKFICKFCKFGCISNEGLKNHMLNSHGNLVHFMLE